ncbi:MAG: hypothetical protein IJ111_13975 [Eggerthellaceae bacterium]|nr:hypothetical protein [Eggerthellaceae bacterium]
MADENEALTMEEGKLFHDGFVKGIAEYVKKCPTPQTIAIKGDWGTGKTSLINLVEEQLRAETEPAEGDNPDAKKYCDDIITVAIVDVWQQSVANPNANPYQHLVAELAEKLQGSKMDMMEKVSEFTSIASKIVGAALANAAEESKDSDSVLNWFAAEDDSGSDETFSRAKYKEEFQSKFSDALGEIAQEFGKPEDSRIVVFVDGLDHISPEAAVDLMEHIKVYLECPRCVFVLAADEKVVFDGVRKKFGDKVGGRRMKMLFDKLVQVPLSIPESAYNMDALIKKLLKDKQGLSGEFADVVSTLVKEPVPRNIARYISATDLYRSIFGGTQGVEDSSLAMLFAAVILKTESAQGFNAIAECARGEDAQFVENLKTALGSLSLDSGVDWAMIPALWRGGEGVDGDAAKRSTFLFWVQKLK